MTEAVAATQSGGRWSCGLWYLGHQAPEGPWIPCCKAFRAEDNGAATGLTAQPVGTGHGGGRMTDRQKGKA